MEQLIFNDEMILAQAPEPINVIGLGMGGPVVIAHGTEEQKKRYLSPLLSAEEIWCQGFSEPNAGSDLSGLQTRAEDKGDHYLVNGQKVWTTLAHVAKWCMLRHPRAQGGQPARRPHLPAGRHGEPRRRGAAAGPDHWRRRVQRDLLQGRQGPEVADPRRGRQRLGRGDDHAAARARHARHGARDARSDHGRRARRARAQARPRLRPAGPPEASRSSRSRRERCSSTATEP